MNIETCMQAVMTGPAPDTVDRLTFADGASLRWAHWRGQGGGAARNIVLLGGRGEFIEKYGEVAHELLGRGFEVWSLDWRGQGLSGRFGGEAAQGHIDSFETYLHDLDAFLTGPAAARRGETVVLAHSMGAHLALRHAARRKEGSGMDRLVLVAPMIDIALPRHVRAAARGLASAARLAGMGRRYAPGQRAMVGVEPVEQSRRTRDAARGWSANGD